MKTDNPSPSGEQPNENLLLKVPGKRSLWQRIFIPRFSLRTLLIVVTLSALGFGTCQHLEGIRKAVVEVEDYGGRIEYYEKEIESIGSLEKRIRERVPQCYLDDVRSVTLGKDDKNFSSVLKNLSKFRKLEKVDLFDAKIDDAAFAELSRLKWLKRLVLSLTPVKDSNLVFLAELENLENLELFGTKVSSPGLEHLARLKSLKYLNLCFTEVDDSGLIHLSELNSLKRLDLSNTTVSDTGLEHLCGLTTLEHLYLDETQIGDSGLVHLSKMKSLKWLLLRSTRMSKDAKEKLQSELPNCEFKNE